jgi:uncharacterized protein YdcH (DUF465 family)
LLTLTLFSELERAVQGIETVTPNKVGKELQECVNQFLEEIASEVNAFEAELDHQKEEGANQNAVSSQVDEGSMFFHQRKDFKDALAAIELGKKHRDEIEQHLGDSHFTKLAKQKAVIQNEVRRILQAGQRLDKCYEEGLNLKREREQRLRERHEVLKKLVQDVSEPQVLKQLSAGGQSERNVAKQAKEEQSSEKPGSSEDNKKQAPNSSQAYDPKQTS